MVDPTLLYLDLLKRCLTRDLFEDEARLPEDPHGPLQPFDRTRRREGRDWPTEAETMIALDRLDNLQQCVVTVLRDGIPGDLIETGVWRGGAAILMRAVLRAYGDSTRTVWAADSFKGLPSPTHKSSPPTWSPNRGRFTSLPCRSRTFSATLTGMASSTIRSSSCPVGPAKRFLRPRSSNWPCYASTVTSTSRR